MKRQFLSIFFILIAGTIVSNGDEGSIINTKEGESGRPVRIIVTAGPNWSNTFKAGIITIYATPQIVVWVETLDGEYLDTLFITRRFGEQNWRMAPDQEKDETFRIEAIPFWMYKRESFGLSSPTENTPISDTITSATPDSSFILNSIIDVDVNEICILMEVNLPFDGNNNFPNEEPIESEKYNAASGQPAIVYKIVININEPGTYGMLPVGYSSPSGIDGSLTEDMSVITTALGIIADLKVVIE